MRGMVSKNLLVVLLLGLTLSWVIAQDDDTCPPLVELALQEIDNLCAEAGRNQACYGHINMVAEPQSDVSSFAFEQAGDIVDVADIKTLKLSQLDVEAGVWGVAVMRVQANLPDTLPGQNVTFLLFGDTEIRNAAESSAQQQSPKLEMVVTSSINANVRVGPSSQRAVFTTVSPGQTVVANGRTADSTWISIQADESGLQSGWVAAELLRWDGDVNTLRVIETGTPQFGPMQAFYLNTGVGEATCKGLPSSGLLVQTPQGSGSINLMINEVQVDMGSTVMFRAESGQKMTITPVEGKARATVQGVKRTALAGTEFEIPIDENNIPSGIPSIPVNYNREDYEDLPIEVLERDIDIADALSDEEYETYLEYADILDAADLDDADEIFDYVLENDDYLLDYLIDELDYNIYDFADDAEALDFFEEEGYDLEDYGLEDFNDEGFDEFDDFDDIGDEFDDEGFDEFDDEGFDEFDDIGDEFDDIGDDIGDTFDDVDFP